MSEPQTHYAPYTYYANTCYGLLTWLNTNQNSTKYPGVCRSPGISLLGHIIPDGPPMPRTSMWPAGMPHSTFFAGGAFGQITMVLPEYDAVVVSMGFSTVDDVRTHLFPEYTYYLLVVLISFPHSLAYGAPVLPQQNMDHTAACLVRSVCRVFGYC